MLKTDGQEAQQRALASCTSVGQQRDRQQSVAESSQRVSMISANNARYSRAFCHWDNAGHYPAYLSRADASPRWKLVRECATMRINGKFEAEFSNANVDKYIFEDVEKSVMIVSNYVPICEALHSTERRQGKIILAVGEEKFGVETGGEKGGARRRSWNRSG